MAPSKKPKGPPKPPECRSICIPGLKPVEEPESDLDVLWPVLITTKTLRSKIMKVMLVMTRAQSQRAAMRPRTKKTKMKMNLKRLRFLFPQS